MSAMSEQVHRYELSSEGPRPVAHGYWVAYPAYARLAAENKRLEEQKLAMETAIKHAIHDLGIVNDTLVKMCNVHPFTLTPRELRRSIGLET